MKGFGDENYWMERAQAVRRYLNEGLDRLGVPRDESGDRIIMNGESGVPEGWEWRTERDVTDEYMTSLIAPDGTTVYVGDDEPAAAWLESLLSANSGVPYVPEDRDE